MSSTLSLLHGDISLPSFLPDATYGYVRATDAMDLEAVGIQAVVMNAYHLMQKPGSSTVTALGGLHQMAGWPHPILTDSGGFQAYSLLRQNPKMGRISEKGIAFLPEGAERKFQLTPEKSVQLQLSYGADVVICLDECTHVDDPLEEQRLSAERTIRWAKRCKDEFERLMAERKGSAERRPLLFGVVQGGSSQELRKLSAEALLEIGFDGYGYGGWPLDSKGKLVEETLAYTRSLIPMKYPMHALGVGHPENILACATLGYTLFDSALPTRDARNGRLYAFTSDPASSGFALRGDWFDQLYVHDKKHIKTNRPVYPGCDCPTCSRYSVGYLHHLHKTGDGLYFRLATLHNLRFMSRLMELLNPTHRRGAEGAEKPMRTPDKVKR